MNKFKVYLSLTSIYLIAIFYLSIARDPSEHLAPVYLHYLIRFIFPLRGTSLDFAYYPAMFIYFNLDKFGHFILYAVLGLLLFLTLRNSRLKRHACIFAIGFGLMYGALMEYFQAFLTWRTSSYLDLAANALGLVVMQFIIVSLSFIFKKTLAKIAFLIAIITLPIVFMSWFIVEYLIIFGSGIALTFGKYIVLIAFLLAIILDLLILFSHKLLIRWYRARKLEEGGVVEILNSLAAKANVQPPSLFVSKSLPANIFSCGWDSKRASIVIGESALNLLNKVELKALFAHELYHIKNKDLFRSTIVAVFAGILTMFSTIALWASLLTGFGTEEDPAPQFIKYSALALFAPPAAFLMQLSTPRNREFEADRFAIELVGKSALSNALEKLNLHCKGDVNPSHAHLFALNPLKNNIFNSLFESHPPLPMRLRRI